MSERLLLAKRYTADGVASVVTDGTTAWVIGLPVPDADGVGVALPLDVLRKAVDAYDRKMQREHRYGSTTAVQPGCGDCGHAQSDHVYTDCFGDENRCACAGFMPPETAVTA